MKYPLPKPDPKIEKLVRDGQDPGGPRTKFYKPGDTVTVYVNGVKTRVKLPE